jgi:putative solute:sodium symporter small subunit
VATLQAAAVALVPSGRLVVASRGISLYSAHLGRPTGLGGAAKGLIGLARTRQYGIIGSFTAVQQEEPSMQLSAKHREYWRKNLSITGLLLFIWFVATFVVGYFARELNSISFFGWPLAFYMAAQGSLIVYVVIIWYYARHMNNLDEKYGVAEGDEQ